MKKNRLTALVLSAVLCLGVTGCSLNKTTKENSTTQSVNAASGSVINDPEVQKKVAEMQKYIDNFYYFDIDEETQKDMVYQAIMYGLDDPYSVYYSAEDFQILKEDNSGVFEGIGALLTQDAEGVISVVRPIKNSPAEKAGLLAGDIIVQVDDMENPQDYDLSFVVKRIRGAANSEVYLKVLREGEDDYLEFHIVRAQVENYSVDYEMLDDNIGYVQVTEFVEKTFPEFQEAIDDLTAQGAKGFIIDMRDNPGGLVVSATDMVSYLTDENTLTDGVVLYTKNKDDKRMDEYKDTDKHSVSLPIVVLINGNSASAAEIFSGAMRDASGAKLVGVTSFGKGIVQSVVPLSDGSAIKLTIAKYFIPSGYDLHQKGLEPDYEVELDDDRQNAVNLAKEDDAQFKKAVEVMKELIGE